MLFIPNFIFIQEYTAQNQNANTTESFFFFEEFSSTRQIFGMTDLYFLQIKRNLESCDLEWVIHVDLYIL